MIVQHLQRLSLLVGLLGATGMGALGYSQTLKLEYGVNWVDINADGVNDMIVRTRWDVYTAHSADQYLVALAYSDKPDSFMPTGFYNVGFEDDIHDKMGMMVTSEGADCVLSKYQFRLNRHKMLEVDFFRREFGNSYADTQPVMITTYKIMNRQNIIDLGGIGYTPWYFKKMKETRTKKKYCDVSEVVK